MCKVTSVNTNCDHLSTQKSLNMIHKIDKSYVKWFGLDLPNQRVLNSTLWPNPSAKGQLISKCSFDVFKSSEKKRKIFQDFCTSLYLKRGQIKK